MAVITKPSDINKVWADGGDKVSPSDVKIGLGWEVEVPPRQFFNWLDNKQDQFNAHVNQHGIPVWDDVTEYQAGKSYAQGSNGTIYVATQTHTNQNPVSTPSHWEPLFSHGIVKFDTAGVTVWTVPLAMQLGIIRPKVTVVGAGGGGARVNTTAGGGGGAGGAAIGVVDLSGVTSVTVTIGTGGAGAITDNTVGGNGGASSFGGYMSATGGEGGNTLAAGTRAGGLGTGGDINIQGEYGGGAFSGVTGTDRLGSGKGGNSLLGFTTGGAVATGSSAGAPGQNGSGGSGSIRSAVGGAGGNGIIVIEW